MALFAAVFSIGVMLYFSFRFQTLNEKLRNSIDKYTSIDLVTEPRETSTELLEKVKAIVVENRALKARIAELESNSEQGADDQLPARAESKAE